MSENVVKKRISVTMTETYISALDHLVEKGLYLNRGEAVLEALRNFFKSYGIEPFAAKGAEPSKDTP